MEKRSVRTFDKYTIEEGINILYCKMFIYAAIIVFVFVYIFFPENILFSGIKKFGQYPSFTHMMMRLKQFQNKTSILHVNLSRARFG